MSTETSMVTYYASRAAEYERIYLKPERQTDLQTLRAMVERTFQNTHVLELACGTGYWTEILSRCAASVLATDINEEVLALARAKPLNRRTTDFRQEDSYNLPAFQRQFTAGLAAFWWSHVPKARLRHFLISFNRLFSPSGRIVFIDNCYVEGSSTPISRTGENGDTYQLRRLDDGTTHEVLKNFPSAAELRSRLEGLATDIQVTILPYYWFMEYSPLPLSTTPLK